ncbi:LPXTG cell wall anchor domain-containing protein [Streptomyces sp. WAC 04229]|uniref:LPXTG cell wall anchor domain-containing protein n=1 Tax=Streptomyces sp. WAC 04229 TaxID=2203206 RepID=UPI003D760E54
MKIRRVLATAVAAAVTAPVVLLSSAPAFADEKPAAQTQKAKPTIEELKQAVERAQKEYDAAVIAVNDAVRFLNEGMEEETHPTKAALIEAEKAAEDATKVKAEADQAVVDAQAKLDAAITDEDKAAAQTALDEAKTAATEAAEAKTAADTAHTEAQTAHSDARVDHTRKIGLLQKARDEAKTKLEDAEEALADAEEAEEGEEPGGECVAASDLTAVVSGLPDKVVGGTTETFTLRVTNGTGGTLDEVYPFASAHGFDTKGYKELDSYLDLEWSTAADPKWRDADLLGGTSIGSLKADTSVDVKLRLKVDADVLAGQGSVYVTADYLNDDGSCGGYPDLDDYAFEILPKGGDNAGDPGKPEDPKDKPAPNSPTGQGGTSTTPVNTSSTTTGSLAQTGSNDALPKIALAGGAALVLGAGAVIVTRRRNKNTSA